MDVRRQGTENQGTDVGMVLAVVWVVLGGRPPLAGLEASEPAERSEDVLFRRLELVEVTLVEVVFARRVELESEGAEVEGKKGDLSDALEDAVE
jgi:hypothetical protein